MMKRKKDSLPQTWPDKFKEARPDEERVYAYSNNREYFQAYNAVVLRNSLQIDLFLINKTEKNFSIQCIVKNNHEEFLKKVKELSKVKDLKNKGLVKYCLEEIQHNQGKLEKFLLKQDAVSQMFDYVYKTISPIHTKEELDEIIRPLVNATLYYADVKQKIQ